MRSPLLVFSMADSAVWRRRTRRKRRKGRSQWSPPIGKARKKQAKEKERQKK